jgi:predicted RNA-binding Zn ribbon-like protein
MMETETQASRFEFSGNRLCLDFVNTVEDRLRNPFDVLKTYHDLLQWGEQAHILTAHEVEVLREEAGRQADEAANALQWAITVRETMYHLFRGVIEGAKPQEADLATFNAAFVETMAHACIIPENDGFVWSWQEQDSLERIVWPIVRSAADLLTSSGLKDVRMCAAEDCGWLFLDTSKNHSRRWCDMKTCGNRAKVRKFYREKRQVG